MSRGPAKSFERDVVLDQAMFEFWKRGYAATSVSNLRAVTGLGAKSLYDSFGGKRELFLACIDRYGASILPKMFDDVSGRYPPREALTHILNDLVRISPKPPARGCLIGVAAAGVEDDGELSAALSGLLDRIQHVLETLIEQLPLKAHAPTPHALASMLMTLLQGVHLISRVDNTAGHAQDAITAAQQLIDSCIE